ncbi:MAG: fused MFS/spermidine synthase [Burkholderiales bacterium]
MRAGWLTLLYGGSGLISLAYEVLWARMLSLQFGVSVFGVVVTVAAFMTGLGLGSLVMARCAACVKHPLRWLALLEGGVAVFALLLPWGIQWTGPGIDAAAARLSPEAWYALMAVASFLLLTLPACAMGAGFPLILQALAHSREALGRLYGINTLGAVLGALLPLVLLPVLGWSAALRSVALLGLVVALGFWGFGRFGDRPPIGGDLGTDPQLGSVPKSPLPQPPLGLLLAYGALGGASLMLEVAWTRLFGLVMLRTEYVLALILAVFLSGIGLGSLWASRRQLSCALGWLPWCGAGFALAGLWALPWVSAWVEQARWGSLGMALLTEGGMLLALTLPVTLVLGAWLPILARQSQSSGLELYGANALGAAVGAILAGGLLIPWVGTAATLVLAALAMLLLGLTWNRPFKRWMAPALLVFGIAGYSLATLPPAAALLPQALAGSHDLYRYEDAIAITQVVAQADGQRVLLTDLQRRDASTEPTAVFVQGNQSRLSLLLQPAPHSVLFLGLGTGISDAGSAPYPDLQRSAVELSRGAILAAQHWFAPLNREVLDKTTIHQDDARHFLSAGTARYDVIIGDLFHPDLAGVSSLLSVQQFARARARLSPQGLFVQWLALNQFDPESMRVVLHSFHAVFPQAQLFLDGMHLALVGPRGDWLGAPAMLDNLRRLTPEQRRDATAGEGEMTWLGRYWGPIGVSSGAVQDEWAPVIEFRLPRVRYGNSVDVSILLQQLLDIRPRVEQAQDLLKVPAALQPGFQRAYIGTELLVRSWVAAMRGQASQSDRLIGMAFEANPHDRWTAYALSDLMLAHLDEAVARGLDRQQALQKLLQMNPWQTDALRALWHDQLRRGDPEAETTRLRLLQLSPLDREAQSAKN